MRKLSLIVVALLCGFATTYAQEEFFTPPDYRQIERNVQDATSSLYFPRLMERYLAGDSTLTLEEARHLYFGFTFQPDYAPTVISPYNRRLIDVLSRQRFRSRDFINILRYSNALLEADPFNLRALSAKMLVYAEHDNAEAYMRTVWQKSVVLDAIVSTGDGMSEETPFFVIKAAHQYDILPILGFQFGGEDRLLESGQTNFLSVAENHFGVTRVYFDITPVANHRRR